MQKFAAAMIAVLVVGQLCTLGLLVDRDSGPKPIYTADGTPASPDLAPLAKELQSLREDVRALRASVGGGTPSVNGNGEPVASDSALLERLDRLEEMISSMKEVNEEVALAKLRNERQARFREEDGYVLADELLAQKKFAVGANGILSFLDAHPDHPDARDLMKKARDAFEDAGYREKAMWLHEEIMKKFPEKRGDDLYRLALLKKQIRKFDEAIGHINESLDLAESNQDRVNRMFYRAYLIHQRDGDPAGLVAYRDVAKQAAAIGYRSEEATRRANQIATRLGE
ncbi:MAG: hypothetical protein AAF517_07155 [Planctomycetota bacterium]